MANHDVVKKLIGKIKPIGESREDDVRYANLQDMCNLVNNLLMDISDMAQDCKARNEFSIKRSGEYAEKFLNESITEYTK